MSRKYPGFWLLFKNLKIWWHWTCIPTWHRSARAKWPLFPLNGSRSPGRPPQFTGTHVHSHLSHLLALMALEFVTSALIQSLHFPRDDQRGCVAHPKPPSKLQWSWDWTLGLLASSFLVVTKVFITVGLPVSRTVRNKYLSSMPSSLWCFCYSSPNGLRQSLLGCWDLEK